MTDHQPLVSIIMSVYNGEKFIAETIRSIINQPYQKFELIIVDDCSTDNTVSEIERFNDNRIVLLKNEKNMRLAYSLNKAVKASNGKYIARMDADDVCMPDRLPLQVKFMEENSDIAVLGGSAQQFGARSSLMTYPSEHEKIKVELFFSNPLCHPAVMFRSGEISEWYNDEVKAGQDYELWSRLIWQVKFHNLSNTLVKYRIHPNQTKHILGRAQKQGVILACQNMLSMIGTYSEEETKLLAYAGSTNNGKTVDELNAISQLYSKILNDALSKPEIVQSNLLKRRMTKQKAALVYASLIYRTLTWKEISKTNMKKEFYTKPWLVLKSLLHYVIKKK